MIPDSLRARIEAWRAIDPDPVARDELGALVARADGPGRDRAADAEAELRDRFAGRLSFGTAGLRASLGAGPRRMNRLVVQQLAAGLMRWLGGRAGRDGAGHHGDRAVTVVVGWDARRCSDVFALDVARVVAAAGGRALLLPSAGPTPVLAFAVRHLGADAGIMCTASHNPPADNGAKVYLADGAQIVAGDEAGLAAVIAEVADEGRPVPLSPVDDPAVGRLDASVVDAYAGHVLGTPVARAAAPPPGAAAALPVVYSPLHGVGGELAVRLLRGAGFEGVRMVPAQAAPDAAFPTTPYPDPEEPSAYALALDQARAEGAALVLLNDPDADRLGVAVPAGGQGGEGGWRVLTGNEIGALLCEHVLSRTAGEDRLVVSSFVSSRLLAAVARHHGVHHVEVPTGFKWVIRPALDHPELRFVFGFEESLGFSVDAQVRDKDGLAAAVAFAGVVASLRAGGLGVVDALELLSRRHGHHASRTWSARLEGRGAPERLREVVETWRRYPPTKLAGRRVASVEDLSRGSADLPPTDAVVVRTEDGARMVLRPSGTEPKIKVHLEVVGPVGPGPAGWAAAQRGGADELEDLRSAVAADLGLTTPVP